MSADPQSSDRTRREQVKRKAQRVSFFASEMAILSFLLLAIATDFWPLRLLYQIPAFLVCGIVSMISCVPSCRASMAESMVRDSDKKLRGISESSVPSWFRLIFGAANMGLLVAHGWFVTFGVYAAAMIGIQEVRNMAADELNARKVRRAEEAFYEASLRSAACQARLQRLARMLPGIEPKSEKPDRGASGEANDPGA